jgi:hypothetical protein
MAYPHTGSILTAGGDNKGANTTRTSVSTNIIIVVDGNPVGAIKQISINEQRTIEQIKEIGTDGSVDSVPKSATKITGDCQRVRFDNLRVATAFSRGFVHVAAQRVPFDILILDIFGATEDEQGNIDPSGVVTTVLKNVWINKLDTRYNSDDYIITEGMGFEAEFIYSYVGNGQSATNAVSARPLNFIDNDPFEKQADLGKRRGALDAAGLINVVDSIATT